MGWASDDFDTIDLGDRWLSKRTALLAARLADNPQRSGRHSVSDEQIVKFYLLHWSIETDFRSL